VPPPADLRTARAAWSDALGGAPVVLLRSVDRARALLLRALGVQPGEAVGLPANATRELAEAVKHHPATPRFLALGAELAIEAAPAELSDLRVVWAQSCGGASPATPIPDTALLIDASDTVPAADGTQQLGGATAALYGLHLADDSRQSGAVLVCHDPTLALAIEALAGHDDQPDAALVLAQLRRLAGADGLVARQQAALAAVEQGLREAAGLPLLTATPGALAHYVALRVPEPCDGATFYAYVLGEQTPVRWLPALRPLHYAALRANSAAAATAARLARLLLVPVGPDQSPEEIVHTVLGIAKAADYLGLRWYTDPARAAWYGNLMTEWYGADHDAYRPLFDTALPSAH
jgi:hypothetical protein